MGGGLEGEAPALLLVPPFLPVQLAASPALRVPPPHFASATGAWGSWRTVGGFQVLVGAAGWVPQFGAPAGYRKPRMGRGLEGGGTRS